jgi:hypothetical protein
MIMTTFAERYDFAGKTVHPITTYAMSGLGTTPPGLRAGLPGRTHRHRTRGPRREGTRGRRGRRRVAAPHTSARRPVVVADQAVRTRGALSSRTTIGRDALATADAPELPDAATAIPQTPVQVEGW